MSSPSICSDSVLDGKPLFIAATRKRVAQAGARDLRRPMHAQYQNFENFANELTLHKMSCVSDDDAVRIREGERE